MNTCPHEGGALSPITRTPRVRRNATDLPSVPMQVAWLCEYGHVVDLLNEVPIEPTPRV